MRSKVHTEGQNRLGLAELAEQAASEQWLPAHVLPHKAEQIVLGLFKRTVEKKTGQV